MIIKRWLCLITFFIFSHAYAWLATGHELIATIAAQQLNYHAKQKIVELLTTPIDFPSARPTDLLVKPRELAKQLSDIDTASTWADAIKHYRWSGKQGDKSNQRYADMHFIATHVNKKGWQQAVQVARRRYPNNVVDGIDQMVTVLKSTTATATQQAVALRFLIHFVGDIHQPLHCFDRRFFYDHQWHSTYGGNLIRFAEGENIMCHKRLSWRNTVPMRMDNLHALWDCGVDNFVQLSAPYSKRGMQRWRNHQAQYRRYLKKLARSIIKHYATQHLDTHSLNYAQWAAQSAAIAVGQTSPLNQHQLTVEMRFDQGFPHYKQQAKPIVLQQLYLAGTRLAHLLNTIYP